MEWAAKLRTLVLRVAQLMILGGAEEIGANACYLELDGTGILIDAGLHPRLRTVEAFPDLEALEGRPVDLLVVTHAHTDHLGGVPFVMRRFPHVRTLMTRATRDLSHIMLHNGGKILRSEVTGHVPREALEYYTPEQIELVRESFTATDYTEVSTVRGYTGRSDVQLSLHYSGHILGSAGVVIEHQGRRYLHTGDVQFVDQQVMKGALLPRTHADVVITEATNCASDPVDYVSETKKLAAFINSVTAANGSVLIPSFALGKTQEILTLLYRLMRKGTIPYLPIYSGGMGVAINRVYDHYCYAEPVRQPGFEISDIPQNSLPFRHLSKGDYFKEPSIVVASSGMLSKGTTSYRLALEWFRQPSFGIAFIGYQDPTTPGYSVLHSEHQKPFDLAGRTVQRSCRIERLRFSAHTNREPLVKFITDVRPSTVVITHGEPEACDALALSVLDRMPGTRIIIPRKGVAYELSTNLTEQLVTSA